MAANRGTATGGTITGTAYGGDVNDEIVALWKQATGKLASVAGTNTITAVIVPTLAAYVDGQSFAFIPAVNNSGAVTINIDSLGAKAIKHKDGSALATGDLLTTTLYQIMYDGTNFRLTDAATSVTAEIEVLIARHHQTDGTDGGTATSGATQVYPFTEIVVNGISGASLSTNTFTLPPGQYVVEAVVDIRNTSDSKLKLYDATGAAYFADVTAPQIEGSTSTNTMPLFAVIDLSAVTDVELHYDVLNSQSTTGLGKDHGGLSDDEEYGMIKFTRFSAWTSAKTSVSRLGVNVGSNATRKFNARSDEVGAEAIPTADGGTGNLIQFWDTENDGGMKLTVIEEDVTLASGTDVTGVAIPDNAKIIGASFRVITTITGATTWNFGTAAAKTLFGSTIALGSGTTGAQTTETITSAATTTNYQVNGADFTAGVVRASIAYLEMQIPDA